MLTKSAIISGLNRLGVAQGDVLIVHSSLSSFGKVDGGAAAVVDALLDSIGAEGTLVVPAFNYEPGVFDPETTKSIVGAITEEVRLRANAIRSLHPTHSVAAIGQYAEIITEGHEKTHAFARGSALFKALQAKAKALLLGVDLDKCSMIHVAEEIAGLPFLDRSRTVGVLRRGAVQMKTVRRPGCSKGFVKLRQTLEEKNLISEAMIGECEAMLIRARDIVDEAVELMKFDAEALLCDRADCDSCAEARAMIYASEAERQDNEIIELAKEDERLLRHLEEKFSDARIDYFDPDNNHGFSLN